MSPEPRPNRRGQVVEVLLGHEVPPQPAEVSWRAGRPAAEQRLINIDPALRSDEHAQCSLGVRTDQGAKAFDVITIHSSSVRYSSGIT